MVAPASRAAEEACAPTPFARPRSTRQLGAHLSSRLVRHSSSVSAALDWLADRVVLFRYGDLVFVTFGLFAALGAYLTLAWMGVILIGQGVSVGRSRRWHWSRAPGGVRVVAPRAAARLPPAAREAEGGFAPAGLRLLGRTPDGAPGLRHLLLALRRRTAGAGGRIRPGDADRPRHGAPRLPLLRLLLRPADGRRLAITYRNPLAKAVRIGGHQHVRLHPTALYEAVLDLGILAGGERSVLPRDAPRRTFCPGADGVRPRPLRDRVPEGQRRSHPPGAASP